MQKELYIGVMSGTSLDGVDISLCEIDASTCKLLASDEYPFNKVLKQKVLSMIEESTTLKDVGILNIELGKLFANCINTFLTKNSINSQTVKAIGLHGQTLWHAPQIEHAFSMQLGCPNVVRAQTDIPVVADFRSMDVANGGQGAPFAPAFHEEVFKHIEKKVAVLNIGGMANITLLFPTLKGWDTGVGNALMDYWVHKCNNMPYDKDGAFAASGKVHKALLESFMEDAYLQLSPPKSTGREYFNASWLHLHLKQFENVTNEDIQRTLLEFTVQSIISEIKTADINIMIVCGGGTKNSFLMQRLQEVSKILITPSDTYGISSDFMESMAFAWLAYKRVHKQKVNLSHVTGAKQNSILGGIYE